MGAGSTQSVRRWRRLQCPLYASGLGAAVGLPFDPGAQLDVHGPGPQLDVHGPGPQLDVHGPGPGDTIDAALNRAWLAPGIRSRYVSAAQLLVSEAGICASSTPELSVNTS